MNNSNTCVNRVLVRRKDDNREKLLIEEIKDFLHIDLKSLKAYRFYDLECREEILDSILYNVLAEKPVDQVFVNEKAKDLEKTFDSYLCVSLLPGQFNQRNQGLLDNIALFTDQEVLLRSADLYVFEGLASQDLEKIQDYLVNPVDSQTIDLSKEVKTLRKDVKENLENLTFDGFTDYDEETLKQFLVDENLAMNYDDLKFLQDYFKSEDRDPNETELAIIDTYWSDHCRHTTFNTYLDIDFETKTALDKEIKAAFDHYLQMREELGIEKPMSLMSFGTILSKYLRKNNKLEDLEVSSEINACSIKIKVRVEKDGKESLEDYLLLFKNETHNHPTEIEPTGGASTCLGGAIRDPLSARAFVYQAMRVVGAGNPLTPFEETLEGKLPQRKLAIDAAKGYASYGNQIGLAAGYLDEIYHPGYVAKRMEAGAIMACAPIENVKRLDPQDGDLVILLGGKTGRDGIGGATGSSKSHNVESIVTESAQVQKGNAPEERKILRLFRNEKAAKLIKKCNDFGAGGVSVAIGELADGIEIHLDKVPVKYPGLKPKEVAISESQERMAVVVAKKDFEEFVRLADEENLDATLVAEVKDTNRMTMYHKDMVIADLSYDFINTSGAERNQKVLVTSEEPAKSLKVADQDPKNLGKYLKDLNITSKKNIIELFDSTVGRGTVLAPLGGKKQTAPIQVMAAKVAALEGNVNTVSLMSYGFNPYLSQESQYLGGYYAVIESIAKLIAAGSNLDQIRLSFQEFYERLGSEESWSKPLKSLLGALTASAAFDAPPIGGKDSMSGTFEDINVPPTLISFAVTTADIENIISPEFKGKGKLGLVEVSYDQNGLLDLDQTRDNFAKVHQEIKAGNIIAASAITHKGSLPQIFEQALYQTGFNIELDDLYSPKYGSFIVEYLEDRDFIKNIGSFAEEMTVNGQVLDQEDLAKAYLNSFDPVFVKEEALEAKDLKNEKLERKLKSTVKTDRPRVLIPIFYGTNGEYDLAKAFTEAGAEVVNFVYKNRNQEELAESRKNFAAEIKKSHILAFAGGAVTGDQPDGAGKYIANILRMAEVKEAVEYLLSENDGLILGLGNGFQALVKSGLLPYGRIKDQEEEDMTISFNSSGSFVSRIEDIEIKTTNSPWLAGFDQGKVYKTPVAHYEGRLVVNETMLKELLANEQVASVYKSGVNGSAYNIEGLICKYGKIYGRMGHPERNEQGLFKNIDPMEGDNIFKAAVEYFK
ncbi:MAG: phosphoribosylformylglycinamidine synthase [Bacillota bacterium]|nr:phosphoribosylformylglycinamidine synthase [Bacillota bacterium]